MLIKNMGLLCDFAKVKCLCGVIWRGIMVSPTIDMDSMRRKKGNNFFVNEHAQLCCSLHDSQYSITSNNKKNNGFLDRVFKHYNQNHPNGLTTRLARSLGMKRGTIKLDVAKFIGKYKFIQTLQEFGTNTKDTV